MFSNPMLFPITKKYYFAANCAVLYSLNRTSTELLYLPVISFYVNTVMGVINCINNTFVGVRMTINGYLAG